MSNKTQQQGLRFTRKGGFETEMADAKVFDELHSQFENKTDRASIYDLAIEKAKRLNPNETILIHPQSHWLLVNKTGLLFIGQYKITESEPLFYDNSYWVIKSENETLIIQPLFDRP